MSPENKSVSLHDAVKLLLELTTPVTEQGTPLE